MSVQIRLDEVHIWLADRRDYIIDDLLHILSNTELNRAREYICKIQQQEYIITRALLKLLLTNYLNCQSSDIEIDAPSMLKPCIKGKYKIHFNVSHTKDYSIFAFSLDHEVGIDIEFIDQRLDLQLMARNIFSNDQLFKWQKIPYREKVIQFFKKWVLMEAYLKAIGNGWLAEEEILQQGRSMAIRNLDNNIVLSNPTLITTPAGFAGALCLINPKSKITVKHFGKNDIRRTVFKGKFAIL